MEIILGLILFLGGLFTIFFGRSYYYKRQVEKHNFEAREEIMEVIRPMVGIVFIIIGLATIILNLLN